ncbi:Pentatricopeptide repeat [Macleaya cordata]|uniref:Pentatricopeptide repeat n=1 Tax=Macleaya cordata TaxID=56857 RepID=A0A200R5J1_MACCD|nr:Pentatricopeptide repeat [Macleaya cordata]
MQGIKSSNLQKTFHSLLQVSSTANHLKQIHCRLLLLDLHQDQFLITTLIKLLWQRFRAINYSLSIFYQTQNPNTFLFNAMIQALSETPGFEIKAVSLYSLQMHNGTNDPSRRPNRFTFPPLLKACVAAFASVKAIQEIHTQLTKLGVKPNEITLVSVISACANLGALEFGRRIHSFMEDNRYELDLFVASSLIDMYCKCGMVEDALKIFKKMPQRNVVTCSSMIVGLAMNGRAEEAIGIFEEMRFQGMFPNDITFVGVLCACCHAGFVEKGQFYFNCMTKEYSLVPKLQHYACIVDLHGRAGHLDQACQFIRDMPIKPDVVVWGALLGACRIHKDFHLGVFAAQRILELDPKHSGGFVFLSNAHARMGDWDGLKKVRRMMEISGMKKIPGKSWIEVNNVVHQFFAGDKSHPESERIYGKLKDLAKLLELQGYKPNVNSVPCDIEEEEKEHSLNVHSEKLAVAFGLINCPEGTVIRIVKNLRVCDDCHSAIKLVSKIVNREIILRDNNRFHHFTGGICSCQDYW